MTNTPFDPNQGQPTPVPMPPPPPGQAQGQQPGQPQGYPQAQQPGQPQGYPQGYPQAQQQGQPQGYPQAQQPGQPQGYPQAQQPGQPQGHPQNFSQGFAAAPQQPRGTLTKQAIAIIAGAAVLVVGGGIFGIKAVADNMNSASGGSDVSQVAQVFPQDTAGYSSLGLTSNTAERELVKASFDTAKAEEKAKYGKIVDEYVADGNIVKAYINSIVASGEDLCGITYAADIEPWAPDSFASAILKSGGVALAIQPKNVEKAKAGIKKIQDCAVKQESKEAASIVTTDIDGYLVVTDNQATADEIKSRKGSLSDNPDFSGTISKFEHTPRVLFWGKDTAAAITAAAKRNGAENLDENDDTARLLGLPGDLTASSMGAFSFTPLNIAISYINKFDEQKLFPWSPGGAAQSEAIGIFVEDGLAGIEHVALGSEYKGGLPGADLDLAENSAVAAQVALTPDTIKLAKDMMKQAVGAAVSVSTEQPLKLAITSESGSYTGEKVAFTSNVAKSVLEDAGLLKDDKYSIAGDEKRTTMAEDSLLAEKALNASGLLGSAKFTRVVPDAKASQMWWYQDLQAPNDPDMPKEIKAFGVSSRISEGSMLTQGLLAFDIKK